MDFRVFFQFVGCFLLFGIPRLSCDGLRYHQGETVVGEKAVRLTMLELRKLRRKLLRMGRSEKKKRRFARVDPRRTLLPQNPNSPEISHYAIKPEPVKKRTKRKKYKSWKKRNKQDWKNEKTRFRGPQKVAMTFLGGTLNDSGSYPPDSMGAVGPTQYIVLINGLLRSFNKQTGYADGILDDDPDTFFLSVNTSRDAFDPRIRYDRAIQRWFMICINGDEPRNRIMLAVSDGPIITRSTTWSFFYFNSLSGYFFDYPTLGIDEHALYIGGKTFGDTSRADEREDVYVVNKSSLTSGGPIVYTRFGNLLNFSTRVGPHVTQGVDNFDASPTYGYFIAVDNFTYGELIVYKVSDPAGTPSISDPISITIPTTYAPIDVRHKGNNRGSSGYLDGIDDRLMCAHIRNNKLWTTHQVGVNNNGVSSSRVTVTRNGCRWYEFDMSGSIPSLVQSATFYHDTADNATSAKNYWMPSIMTSGQGHMALGCTVAGSTRYCDGTAAGKLRRAALGTMKGGTRITKTPYSYNPSADPGSFSRGRRWGDYSYTCLDPDDDMTMWSIQEYCYAANRWGVRVAKLQAPPPATPKTATPNEVPQGESSIDVIIEGNRVKGSEFYDPGPGFENRISATVGGGVTVNSVEYIDPRHVRLNISTVGATTGNKKVRIYNPDGRRRATKKLIKVV